MDGGKYGAGEAGALLDRLDAAAEKITTPSGAGTMIWRRWGAGSPVVLLHGGAGSWTHWVRNIEPLAAHHELWVPDIPGYGDSALPDPPENAETMATTLAAGIVTLVPPERRIAVVGFSFGGIVGGIMAALLGERVRLFVAVGSAGLGLPFAPMEALGRWRGLPEAESRAVMRRNARILMLAHDESLDELAMAAYAHGVRLARVNGRNASRAGLLKEALPRIKGRLGGIWGELDSLSGPQLGAIAALWHATQADADLRILKNTGHWAAFENAPEFNRNLLELLA